MSELFMVSRAAAEEIRRSMDLGDADGMGLRIAASRSPDGIHYRMGLTNVHQATCWFRCVASNYSYRPTIEYCWRCGNGLCRSGRGNGFHFSES